MRCRSTYHAHSAKRSRPHRLPRSRRSHAAGQTSPCSGPGSVERCGKVPDRFDTQRAVHRAPSRLRSAGRARGCRRVSVHARSDVRFRETGEGEGRDSRLAPSLSSSLQAGKDLEFVGSSESRRDPSFEVELSEKATQQAALPGRIPDRACFPIPARTGCVVAEDSGPVRSSYRSGPTTVFASTACIHSSPIIHARAS